MGKMLEEAILGSAKNYPDTFQDPNTSDLLWVADGLGEFVLKWENAVLPKPETGLKIVNIIEDNFVKGVLIRDLSSQELIERAQNSVKILRRRNLLNFGEVETLLAALMIWHGCLNMAKMTRIVDSRGTKYNDVLRHQLYEKLIEEATDYEKSGFPWIKYGVTLAKMLIKERKDDANITWLSADSLYFK